MVWYMVCGIWLVLLGDDMYDTSNLIGHRSIFRPPRETHPEVPPLQHARRAAQLPCAGTSAQVSKQEGRGQ